MMDLAYLQKTPPKQTALLKAECADFVVKEQLGYDMSGDGEFVAVKVRKTDCNTLFVGEQLAKFAGISARNMSYAGLKDRKAVTEQWFSLQMPGQPTPDFSQFSLEGDHFEILLRNAEETDKLKERLDFLAKNGFPNYFTEQRFGRDGNNLTQALRWANGEINVKDRNKRSFYLSAARSEIFNLILSKRMELNLAQQILVGDVLQLNGSHSWFVVDESEDLAQLQQRLAQQDVLLTAPLIGEEEKSAVDFEHEIFAQHQALFDLMRQERMKAARRPILMQPQQFQWQFEPNGLRLQFALPAGSYATALIRELVNIEN